MENIARGTPNPVVGASGGTVRCPSFICFSISVEGALCLEGTSSAYCSLEALGLEKPIECHG